MSDQPEDRDILALFDDTLAEYDRQFPDQESLETLGLVTDEALRKGAAALMRAMAADHPYTHEEWYAALGKPAPSNDLGISR